MTKGTKTMTVNVKAERVNNFNLEWQMRRLEVKKIKDVQTKVTLVKDYALKDSKVTDEGEVVYSKARVMRALNWARTTRFAYQKKDAKATSIIDGLIDILVYVGKQTVGTDVIADADVDIDSYDVKELGSLVKDLERRKYKLKFKGVKPKNHVVFVNVIQSAIAARSDRSEKIEKEIQSIHDVLRES